MSYKEIEDLVDILMNDPYKVEEILSILKENADLIKLCTMIDDIMRDTVYMETKNEVETYDTAKYIRERINMAIDGRSLEEYKLSEDETIEDETIEESLNFADDEYRENWLENLLNDPIWISREDGQRILIEGFESDEERKEWIKETKYLTETTTSNLPVSGTKYNKVPLDFVELQKDILEAKNNNKPINENPRAMLLVLKYYGCRGMIFAISDSLRNNPIFLGKVISGEYKLTVNSMDVLNLCFVNDETWAEVAKISKDDNIKSKLLTKRLIEDCRYEVNHYYYENAEKYNLEETINYRGYLDDEDFPNPDCNDIELLKYVLEQKDDMGKPIIPAKELSKYYGIVAQKDDELNSITEKAIEENLEPQKPVEPKVKRTLIEQEEISPELEAWLNDEETPLQKKENELSALEKKEKAIAEAEALGEKQNGKNGHDIGE